MRAVAAVPDLINTAEVAAIFGVNVRTVARWRRVGTGPAFRKLGPGVTSPIRYERAEVLAFGKKTLR